MEDYTGEYTVDLMPCTVSSEQPSDDDITSDPTLAPTSYPLYSDPPGTLHPTDVLNIKEEPQDAQKTRTIINNEALIEACEPHPVISFVLPLSIQSQVRPVPLVYTLNTHFQIFNNQKTFLEDPRINDNPQVHEQNC